MKKYTAADFKDAQQGDEIALTAVSSNGNRVERFGTIDTVHSDGVTIKLIREEKGGFRRVRFEQIDYLLFL